MKKGKGKICDDEMSVSCVNYLSHICKNPCQNPDNGLVSKCSCLMELVKDHDMISTAEIILRVYSQRDEKI